MPRTMETRKLVYHARMRGLAITPLAGHFVCFSLLAPLACAARPIAQPSMPVPPAAVSAPPPSIPVSASEKNSKEEGAGEAATFAVEPEQRQPEQLPLKGNFSAKNQEILAASGHSWAINEIGPFKLEAFGALGSWVALCSKRDGALRLFAPPSQSTAELGLSGAIPRRVDRLVGWSDGGRYLATLESSRLWLLDLSLGTELDLSSLQPDLKSDKRAWLRTLAFASDERELALLTTSGSIELITLPFSKLTRRTVVPSRPPWQIRYAGAYLIAESGPRGSWPVPPAAAPPLRCETDPSASRAFSRASEPGAAFAREAELLLRGERAATFQSAPGFLMTFGAGWIRREEDGRLLLVEGRVQKQLTSARCGARVRYADDFRRLLLVACEKYRPRPEPPGPKGKPKKPEYSFPLYLIGPGSVRELGLSDARAGYDLEPAMIGTDALATPELIAVTSDGQPVLIDLSSRSAQALASGERVLTTEGRVALIRRGGAVARVEFDRRGLRHERKALYAETSPFEAVQLAGSYAAIGQVILHPTEETRVLEAAPIALHPDGAVLTASALEAPWLKGPFLVSRPDHGGDSRAPIEPRRTAPQPPPTLR